jgi:hypothetical protein
MWYRDGSPCLLVTGNFIFVVFAFDVLDHLSLVRVFRNAVVRRVITTWTHMYDKFHITK